MIYPPCLSPTITTWFPHEVKLQALITSMFVVRCCTNPESRVLLTQLFVSELLIKSKQFVGSVLLFASIKLAITNAIAAAFHFFLKLKLRFKKILC